MTDEQHQELAQILHNARGKVALSGYHCDLIDKLYGDWAYIEAPTKNCHSSKKPRKEVLWTNYDLNEEIEDQRHQKSLISLFDELQET